MDFIGQDIPETYEDLLKLYRQLLDKVQEAESACEKAETAMIAKSEFLANMSHDLRTPLHAILSYSRFGIEKIDRIDTEKIVKYFKNIELSGKKLQEMLNKIVDLSKLESGRMAFQMYSSNLSLVVQSLLKEHQSILSDKRIQVDSRIPETIDTVLCDQNKIAQVMKILFNNAIYHAPEASTIILTSETNSSEAPEGATNLTLSFTDQRAEPAPREAVDDFDAYIEKERVRTGTGIDGVSLAIAYEIVKYHKGAIRVQNPRSGEVTYSLSLPIETQSAL